MSNTQLPIIVAFANQKGGVGKTTLCVCFANYLSAKGLKVSIVDCDRQQSIARCRKRDLETHADVIPPYVVTGHRIIDRKVMYDIIKDIYQNHTDEIVLIDCPGSMTEDWIIPLLCNTDVLVIPYHYDNITISSTSEFILFADRINKSAKKANPMSLFLIPNLQDKRIGRKEEIERWEKIRRSYSEYGVVTPFIEVRASMLRISTVEELDSQSPVVKNAFDEIYEKFYADIKPINNETD